MFGKGISAVGDLLDLASNANIVNKAGAWFSYNGEKIGQGRENAKQFLTENPALYEEIDHKVRVFYGIEPGEEEATEASPEAETETKATKGKKKAATEE